MRHLSCKQKKIINQWFAENYTGAGSIGFDEFPLELYEELEEINDMEILYQCVVYHINELRSKFVQNDIVSMKDIKESKVNSY